MDPLEADPAAVANELTENFAWLPPEDSDSDSDSGLSLVSTDEEDSAQAEKLKKLLKLKKINALQSRYKRLYGRKPKGRLARNTEWLLAQIKAKEAPGSDDSEPSVRGLLPTKRKRYDSCYVLPTWGSACQYVDTDNTPLVNAYFQQIEMRALNDSSTRLTDPYGFESQFLPAPQRIVNNVFGGKAHEKERAVYRVVYTTRRITSDDTVRASLYDTFDYHVLYSSVQHTVKSMQILSQTPANDSMNLLLNRELAVTRPRAASLPSSCFDRHNASSTRVFYSHLAVKIKEIEYSVPFLVHCKSNHVLPDIGRKLPHVYYYNSQNIKDFSILIFIVHVKNTSDGGIKTVFSESEELAGQWTSSSSLFDDGELPDGSRVQDLFDENEESRELLTDDFQRMLVVKVDSLHRVRVLAQHEDPFFEPTLIAGVVNLVGVPMRQISEVEELFKRNNNPNTAACATAITTRYEKCSQDYPNPWASIPEEETAFSIKDDTRIDFVTDRLGRLYQHVRKTVDDPDGADGTDETRPKPVVPACRRVQVDASGDAEGPINLSPLRGGRNDAAEVGERRDVFCGSRYTKFNVIKTTSNSGKGPKTNSAAGSYKPIPDTNVFKKSLGQKFYICYLLLLLDQNFVIVMVTTKAEEAVDDDDENTTPRKRPKLFDRCDAQICTMIHDHMQNTITSQPNQMFEEFVVDKPGDPIKGFNYKFQVNPLLHAVRPQNDTRLTNQYMLEDAHAVSDFALKSSVKGSCQSHHDRCLPLSVADKALERAAQPWWIGMPNSQNGIYFKHGRRIVHAPGMIRTDTIDPSTDVNMTTYGPLASSNFVFSYALGNHNICYEEEGQAGLAPMVLKRTVDNSFKDPEETRISLQVPQNTSFGQKEFKHVAEKHGKSETTVRFLQALRKFVCNKSSDTCFSGGVDEVDSVLQELMQYFVPIRCSLRCRRETTQLMVSGCPEAEPVAAVISRVWPMASLLQLLKGTYDLSENDIELCEINPILMAHETKKRPIKSDDRIIHAFAKVLIHNQNLFRVYCPGPFACYQETRKELQRDSGRRACNRYTMRNVILYIAIMDVVFDHSIDISCFPYRRSDSGEVMLQHDIRANADLSDMETQLWIICAGFALGGYYAVAQTIFNRSPFETTRVLLNELRSFYQSLNEKVMESIVVEVHYTESTTTNVAIAKDIVRPIMEGADVDGKLHEMHRIVEDKHTERARDVQQLLVNNDASAQTAADNWQNAHEGVRSVMDIEHDTVFFPPPGNFVEVILPYLSDDEKEEIGSLMGRTGGSMATSDFLDPESVIMLETDHPACRACKTCMINAFVPGSRAALTLDRLQIVGDEQSNYWFNGFDAAVGGDELKEKVLKNLGIVKQSFPFLKEGANLFATTLKTDPSETLFGERVWKEDLKEIYNAYKRQIQADIGDDNAVEEYIDSLAKQWPPPMRLRNRAMKRNQTGKDGA